MRIAVTFAAFSVAMVVGASASYADTQCATPEQSALVQEFYTKPGPLPVMAAGSALPLSEVQILSGMAADMAIGTTGENFTKIWEQMAAWDSAVILIVKAGNVIEIHSPVPTGEPSTRSNFFNLDDGAPFRGHLRSDLLTSIYLLEMPLPEDRIARGVFFYDESGESTFGAILGGAGFVASESDIAKFESLKSMMQSLPRACSPS